MVAPCTVMDVLWICTAFSKNIPNRITIHRLVETNSILNKRKYCRSHILTNDKLDCNRVLLIQTNWDQVLFRWQDFWIKWNILYKVMHAIHKNWKMVVRCSWGNGAILHQSIGSHHYNKRKLLILWSSQIQYKIIYSKY